MIHCILARAVPSFSWILFVLIEYMKVNWHFMLVSLHTDKLTSCLPRQPVPKTWGSQSWENLKMTNRSRQFLAAACDQRSHEHL